MKDGDFLIMGYAPDYGCYMLSDSLRMRTVNGKFGSSQRELYEFYLGCYRFFPKSIKPGITAQAILDTAVEEMDVILATRSFSKQLYSQAAKAFVKTFRQSSKNPKVSLGHWGRHVYTQCKARERPTHAGMAFTIKPAL